MRHKSVETQNSQKSGSKETQDCGVLVARKHQGIEFERHIAAVLRKRNSGGAQTRDREDLNREGAKKRKREVIKMRYSSGISALRRKDTENRNELRVKAFCDERSEAQTVECYSAWKFNGT